MSKYRIYCIYDDNKSQVKVFTKVRNIKSFSAGELDVIYAELAAGKATRRRAGGHGCLVRRSEVDCYQRRTVDLTKPSERVCRPKLPGCVVPPSSLPPTQPPRHC